jgi:hypothetical protein
MKIKIIYLISVATLVFFSWEFPLAGITTNKKADGQSKIQKEEYKGKRTRSYNKSNPVHANPQIKKSNIHRDATPLIPTTAPSPIPIELPTQQEQIQQNQQLMLQQLLPAHKD